MENQVPPTSTKDLAVWKSKDKKVYALIIASVSEEVSRHLVSSKSAWEALKKRKICQWFTFWVWNHTTVDEII